MTLPAHTSVVPTEPSFAETNPCQAVSHARCSASSARPMPTAIDSSAPVSATDDKTQSVAGYKRRAPTAAAGPYSASNLQAAIHHNAAKETEEAVKAKPVDQGEQPVPKAEERRLLLPRQTRIWQLRFRSTCPWQASSRSRRRTRGRGDGWCSHTIPARPCPALQQQRERRGQRRRRRVGQRLIAVSRRLELSNMLKCVSSSKKTDLNNIFSPRVHIVTVSRVFTP